jgi:hypothetical protein
MKAESSPVSKSVNTRARNVFMSVNLREITRFALLDTALVRQVNMLEFAGKLTLAATCAMSAGKSNGNVFRHFRRASFKSYSRLDVFERSGLTVRR